MPSWYYEHALRLSRVPSTIKDLTMLAERLETIRQGADKRIPPDKRAIMHRATADLRASDIMDRVIKVGDPLPAASPPAVEILMRVRASSLNYRDLVALKGCGRAPTKLGIVPLSGIRTI